MADLIRRPQLGYEILRQFDKDRPKLSADVCEQVELQIKYKGYIEKQLELVERMKKLEEKNLPQEFDYTIIKGLRLEAAEKLTKLQPLNVGQASRITGVSPADVTVLMVYFEQNGEI